MLNSFPHSSSPYSLSISTSFYSFENNSSSDNDSTAASALYFQSLRRFRAIAIEFPYSDSLDELLYDAHRTIPSLFPRPSVMATKVVVPITLDMPSFVTSKEVSRLSGTFRVILGFSFRAVGNSEVMTIGRDNRVVIHIDSIRDALRFPSHPFIHHLLQAPISSSHNLAIHTNASLAASSSRLGFIWTFPLY